MYIPKKYGVSRADNCPFCGKTGTAKNKQGVPVCQAHVDKELNYLRCACGGLLDLCTGKWGVFFNCLNCGNINFRKAMELNPQVMNGSDNNNNKNNHRGYKSNDTHGGNNGIYHLNKAKREAYSNTVGSDNDSTGSSYSFSGNNFKSNSRYNSRIDSKKSPKRKLKSISDYEEYGEEKVIRSDELDFM